MISKIPCTGQSRRYFFYLFALLGALALLAGCESKEERAAAFYSNGLALYETQEYEKARLEFLNAVQLSPTMADAYFHLGLIAKRENDIPLVYETMSTAMILDQQNVPAKIHVAELLLFNQKFDEALDIADAALAIAPESYAALRIKAAARLGQKRFADAERLISEAQALKPNDDALYGLRAVIAKERGKNLEAIDYLNKAITFSEDPSQYLLLRSGVHKELGDISALERDYRQLSQANPDKAQYVFALAKVMLDQQRFTDAEAELAQLVKKQANNVLAKQFLVESIQPQNSERAWQVLESMIAESDDPMPLTFFKINWLMQESKYQIAHRELQKIISGEGSKGGEAGKSEGAIKAKDVQKARALLAELLLKQGLEVEANVLIAENLKRNRNHEHSHLLKAQQDLKRKDFVAAIASLRTVLRNNPESVEGLVLLGDVYLASGSILMADDSYRQALDLNPRNVDAAMPVVRTLLASQDLERADNIISQLLKAKPNDVKLLMFYVQISLSKKDWLRALETIAQLRLQPGAEAYAELLSGRVSQAQEDYASAIEKFHAALTLNPRLFSGMQGLSASYVALNRQEELLNFLNRFQEQNPDLLYAHLVAAEVQQSMQQLDKAIEEIEQALAKQPDWSRGYANLAGYKLALGDSDGAQAVYLKGIAKSPGDSYLKILLAGYYEQQRLPELAAQVYKEILNDEPENLVARNNYAVLLLDKLYSAENSKRALELSLPLKSTEDAQLLDTYAWALLYNNRAAEAEAILRTALQLDSTVPDIKFRLGLALIKLQRVEEARVMLNRALRQSPKDSAVHAAIEESLAQLLESSGSQQNVQQ